MTKSLYHLSSVGISSRHIPDKFLPSYFSVCSVIKEVLSYFHPIRLKNCSCTHFVKVRRYPIDHRDIFTFTFWNLITEYIVFSRSQLPIYSARILRPQKFQSHFVIIYATDRIIRYQISNKIGSIMQDNRKNNKQGQPFPKRKGCPCYPVRK